MRAQLMKRPIVMFGDTRSNENISLLRERNWGRMFCVAPPTPFPYELWGFDNNAFKTWQDAGFPMNLPIEIWNLIWSADDYQRRLAVAMDADNDPYLAVVPDIPASDQSLKYSLQWIKRLPPEWPWYLAVQDGMIPAEVEEVLHLFGGIFLGGSDKFKCSAYRWAKLAHKHRRHFHYGRAGTPRKVKHAFAVGADSLDSTFACWTRERTKELCDVWDGLGIQQEMWG